MTQTTTTLEPKVVSQEKRLGMHPQLLLDVIKRQAGTLEKALLEGTMNSIEAGASKVEVSFYTNSKGNAEVMIADDGMGIVSEEDIEKFFETFGTPHDTSENKIWAQFRMGRGQMFSFGRNIWRTANFIMDVDVKHKGLTYTLYKVDKFVNGCVIQIELYDNPIGGYLYPSIDALKEKLKEQILFVSTPVYFNKEQLNVNPKESKWDFEDEEAYYLFNHGEGTRIYNLGAYVKTLSSYQSGIDGIVVSKKQLKVNFARNDIQSDCEIFQLIQLILRQHRADKVEKKTYTTLTEPERYSLLRDIHFGDISFDTVKKARVLQTSQGKWLSLSMFLADGLPWAVEPLGSRKADMAMEKSVATCLSSDMLNKMDYNGSPENFIAWLCKEYLRKDTAGRYTNPNASYSTEIEQIEIKIKNKSKNFIETDALNKLFSSSYIILSNDKLSVTERRILTVLNRYGCWKDRTIFMGKSEEALAWTDGSSSIILDRVYVEGLNLRELGNVLNLFTVLAHEMAHDNSSQGTHMHGLDFYENFYAIIMGHRRSIPLRYAYSFSEAMETIKKNEIKESIQKRNKQEEKALLKRIQG